LDDSVVILWKLLTKYPKPVLARANYLFEARGGLK
jgi:hypothetical protein